MKMLESRLRKLARKDRRREDAIMDEIKRERKMRTKTMREQAAARERYEAVNAACNALLRRQMTCGKCCHWCAEKCEELQAWLDVGEK